MRNDSIEQILISSDKAELLEAITTTMETANRVIVMVEELADMEDGGKGIHTSYHLFGFRQLYEVDGFIHWMHNEIMEDE